VYVPRPNALDDEAELRALVRHVGSAQLVTVGDDGYPRATLLPVVWEGDEVRMHLARANPHWKEIADDAPVLLVVDGAQAYVSPSWYAGKAEHGRVVPTWNYSAVQIRGRARVHEDPERLLASVTELTDLHEGREPTPWQVDDAPPAFVAGQLRGIVGLDVRVESVVGKAKLSQNRSEVDRRQVVEGLVARGRGQDAAVADGVAGALES